MSFFICELVLELLVYCCLIWEKNICGKLVELLNIKEKCKERYKSVIMYKGK